MCYFLLNETKALRTLARCAVGYELKLRGWAEYDEDRGLSEKTILRHLRDDLSQFISTKED